MDTQDILNKNTEVMSGLKDFQRATVERIDYLFRNGQDRVLVADEVGMGKTMIAKGVIAKTAALRKEEGDDLFKVVYICSNQSIAHQNLSKLDVFDTLERNEDMDFSQWRLSMQFITIKYCERVFKEKNEFVQLLTLTPGTSFKHSNGAGTLDERMLLGCVVEQILKNEYPDNLSWRRRLKKIMINNVKYWEESYDHWKKLVADYLPYKSDVHSILLEDNDFMDYVTEYLENYESGQKTSPFINYIRKAFAKISINMLNPDLVIMDEFQRFSFIIGDEDESEASMLAKAFLTPNNSNSLADKIRVLLLSATPYKLYSTLEDLGDTNNDEHYNEFMNVVKFLNNDENKYDDFKNIWENYSLSLKELKNDNVALLNLKENKAKAENALYNCICRTERISVMDNADFIDDTSKNNALKINENDIKSYLEIIKLITENEIKADFSIDYVKSSPYILSFMQKYDLKQKIEKYFQANPDKVAEAKSSLLWIDRNIIQKYKKLPAVNARLERLISELFNSKTENKIYPELFLWVPPSMPYYEFGGVYRNSEGFSKILIFSAWEMVPRMIGSLVSYEEERRTIRRLLEKRAEEKRNDEVTEDLVNYFDHNYPKARLSFAQDSILNLLYPSQFLADIYEFDGKKSKLEKVEKDLAAKIEEKLQPLFQKYNVQTGNVDNRWYWLAPMLIDGEEYVEFWINSLTDFIEDEDEQKAGTQFNALLDKVKTTIKEPNLGKCPSDLVQVLVDATLGSPAVCLLRNLPYVDLATYLALKFRKYLNSPVRTAIIELSNRTRKFDDNYHWQDVLMYCKNGNLQSMIDEYIHLLWDSCSDEMEIALAFADSLLLRSSPFQAETYPEFASRISGDSKSQTKLRTHYAVGFTESKNQEKGVARKDALRKTFNSPFWPFVMASTSIGQEGLDFHLYCRKVMHWNLPSNPIDLEQREGRINRFKCLAIRQNLAKKYCNQIDFAYEGDLWDNIFEKAHSEKKDGQSDLIPFWCLGKDQEIKIERILAHYPVSKDEAVYERLIKILSLYRLTLGQPRQEELLKNVFQDFEDIEPLKELFIDLSPYNKKSK